MNNLIYLDAFAALTPEGLYCAKGFTKWESDQAGAADVTRRQVLAKPYPTFGKLSLPDRLAFAAASLLFSNYGGFDNETCGICIGIPLGSLPVDLRYCESVRAGFPSPAVFSATLPSSPVSEIAIFYKIKGPNRVVANAQCAGLAALDIGYRMLRMKKSNSMLILLQSGLEPNDRSCGFVPLTGCVDPSVYAFLLTTGRNPAGMAYRCDFSCRTSQNPLAETSDEHYFHTVAQTLAFGKDAHIDFSTCTMNGSLVLTKEQ